MLRGTCHAFISIMLLAYFSKKTDLTVTTPMTQKFDDSPAPVICA